MKRLTFALIALAAFHFGTGVAFAQVTVTCGEARYSCSAVSDEKFTYCPIAGGAWQNGTLRPRVYYLTVLTPEQIRDWEGPWVSPDPWKACDLAQVSTVKGAEGMTSYIATYTAPDDPDTITEQYLGFEADTEDWKCLKFANKDLAGLAGYTYSAPMRVILTNRDYFMCYGLDYETFLAYYRKDEWESDCDRDRFGYVKSIPFGPDEGTRWSYLVANHGLEARQICVVPRGEPESTEWEVQISVVPMMMGPGAD